MRLHLLCLTIANIALAFACAGTPEEDPDFSGMSEDDFSEMANQSAATDYLKLVTVRDSFSNTYLMHWPDRKMPLVVWLPAPPPGLFEDSDAALAAVRQGVLDWTGVASPGVPSFEFTDDQGDADIPIVWAAEPDGDWYIAHCAYDVSIPNRFGVSRILVTGRWDEGDVASIDDLYGTMLHEMGHALGLMGHSDSREDVMYPYIRGRSRSGLSDADRVTLQKLYEHGNRPFRGRRGRR